MSRKSRFNKLKNQTCLICFESDCNTRLIPCRHTYHQQCLQTWVDYQGVSLTKCVYCAQTVQRSFINPKVLLPRIQHYKPCPSCHILIEKISGCDTVKCAWCHTFFDYEDGFTWIKSTREIAIEKRVKAQFAKLFWIVFFTITILMFMYCLYRKMIDYAITRVYQCVAL